jgi:hypothetical protein
LRWLVCKQFVLHLHDITRPDEPGRVTRHTDSLKFTDASCFVLTDIGVEFAVSFFRSLGRTELLATEDDSQQDGSLATPFWDPDARELRVDSLLIKRYRVPAPNQERILSAFEEEQWPSHIYDPLPPTPEIDVKQRLHTAIRSLNRNQKIHRIQFSGDGCGKGVCWHYVRHTNARATAF